MIRTVIIEDEPNNQKFLSHILATYYPKLALVGQESTVSKGIKLLQTKAVDLVFLDAELQDGDGFEVLRSVDSKRFITIFLSRHKGSAIEAIRHAAFDYLMKPVLIKELHQTMRRVQEKLEIPSVSTHSYSNRDEASDQKRIILQDGKSQRVINLPDLLHLKANDHYITVYLKNQGRFVITGVLRDLEKQLPAIFLRIHRAHVINLKAIKEISGGRGGLVTLVNGNQVPIAYRKKVTLKKLLMSIL